MPAETAILPKVIALCSRHGYVYKAGGGSSSTGAFGLYDFGPLGVELKQNICNEWWYSMVTSRGNIHGIESPYTVQEIPTRNDTTMGEGNSQAVCEDPIHVSEGTDFPQKEHNDLSAQSSILRASVYQGILLNYLRIKDLVNKQLPFGIAQKGTCFRPGESPDVEKFIYNAREHTQLSVQYYCSAKTATQSLDSWQRERLEWWRKFAENPSNFIAADIQTRGEVQMLDIQYKFPWGSDTIERIYNRGKQPMEELYRWVEDGAEAEKRLDKNAKLQEDRSSAKEKDGDLVKKTDMQKNEMDVLKGREGRKAIIPHTLEMTTGLERGMLAYIVDGYREKRMERSEKVTITEEVSLHPKLAPIKVAIITKGSSSRELKEIGQYLEDEFRKSNINVLQDNSSKMTGKMARFDAMGVLFSIVLQDKTIKEGTVGIRSRGQNILQTQHVTQVKEFVQRHLDHV